MRGGVLSILAAGAVAAVLPATCHAYGWPVEPFNQPHAIRGGFDDPRLHLDPDQRLAAFHFGVDIAVPDGTPVYAVEAGRVSAHSDHVTVLRPNGREFGYWHVVGVVATGEQVEKHQLLGYVLKGWDHVHFSERRGGLYRNPLRRGALTPYSDRTVPTVASIHLVDTHGNAVDAKNVAGAVGVVAEIYDTPPIPPPPPWQLARLAPATIRWRLLHRNRLVRGWRLAVDFRRALMPDALFDWIYAPGTYQNKANRPGRYVFWLVHNLNTASLAPGSYVLQVQAADTRGNLARSWFALTVASRASENVASP